MKRTKILENLDLFKICSLDDMDFKNLPVGFYFCFNEKKAKADTCFS